MAMWFLLGAGLTITIVTPIAIGASGGEHRYDERSLLKQTIFASTDLNMATTSEPATQHLKGSKILVSLRGDPQTLRTMAGHEFAFDNIDKGSGRGMIVAKEDKGSADDKTPVLAATGLFFEGVHQPNGTMSTVGSSGEVVTGNWTILEQRTWEEMQVDWDDQKTLKRIMDTVPEYCNRVRGRGRCRNE